MRPSIGMLVESTKGVFAEAMIGVFAESIIGMFVEPTIEMFVESTLEISLNQRWKFLRISLWKSLSNQTIIGFFFGSTITIGMLVESTVETSSDLAWKFLRHTLGKFFESTISERSSSQTVVGVLDRIDHRLYCLPIESTIGKCSVIELTTGLFVESAVGYEQTNCRSGLLVESNHDWGNGASE